MVESAIRVLVVDDEEVILGVISRMLTSVLVVVSRSRRTAHPP
jgi:CheY-like chemotaxis protein